MTTIREKMPNHNNNQIGQSLCFYVNGANHSGDTLTRTLNEYSGAFAEYNVDHFHAAFTELDPPNDVTQELPELNVNEYTMSSFPCDAQVHTVTVYVVDSNHTVIADCVAVPFTFITDSTD